MILILDRGSKSDILQRSREIMECSFVAARLKSDNYLVVKTRYSPMPKGHIRRAKMMGMIEEALKHESLRPLSTTPL